MRRRRWGVPRRVLRPLVKASPSPGLWGRVGRYCGQTLGWPLECGYRLIIDDPAEWIQRTIVDSCTYEPNIEAIIRALLEPGDTFFDIGANIGYHTLGAAATGARVYAFEPVPRLRNRLVGNLRLNGLGRRVVVSELALSNRNGSTEFYLARRLDDGSHSLIPGVPAQSIECITVQTARLDDHLQASGTPLPTVMKIDVEGAEALVLDGAVALLDSATPPAIIIETADRLADQIQETASSVLGRLFQRNYHVFRIPEAAGPLQPVSPNRVSGELANYVGVPAGSPLLDRLQSRLPASLRPARGTPGLPVAQPATDGQADGLSGPLVSIILPTYNGSAYLDGALRSCLNQTYRNLELIVVDDCSTDDTPNILRRWAEKDARIRVVTHETNKKLPGALNTGFAHARGEYLTWTSDDNLYEPQALERMVGVLTAQPDVSVVYATYSVIDDAGQVINTMPAKPPSELVLGNVVGACFLYTKAVQEAIGPYDEAIFLAEDYDFWLRAAQRFQFAPLNTDLYAYREHQKSLSASRCIEFSAAYCKAVSKSLDYFASSEPALKGRVFFKFGVHLFAAGRLDEARDALRRSVVEFKTLELWPGFAVNQLIYTHGGELRDESSLRSLLGLVNDVSGSSRLAPSAILSGMHVVASFKAHREGSRSRVRFHFTRAVRHNPMCLANRGLVKIFLQACTGWAGL
ncbi:MAG: FkbM family methyltransferase [Chloroflexota bacterium]